MGNTSAIRRTGKYQPSRRALLAMGAALFATITMVLPFATAARGQASTERLRVQRFVEVTEGVGGLPLGVLEDQDRFGHTMANLGDLDGDGVPDLAVGAYTDDDGGTDRGAVYITFMNADGTVKSLSKISDTEGGFTAGLHDGERFGKEVAALGDLDGDNIPDLLAGAEGHNGNGTGRGAAYVVFLNADGTVKGHQELSETDGGLASFVSLDDSDFFGQSLGNLGDLDGDNITDVAIGAYFDDDGGSNRGAVYVVFLNADGTAKNVTKLSSGTNGAPLLEDNGYFGYALTPAGDLDGDTVTDMMVAAHFADLGGTNRGALYTLLLNADGTVKASQLVGSGTGGFDGVVLDGDTLGTGLELLGDLDGDSIGEIMVGARRADDGGPDRGTSHIMFMAADGTVRDTMRISQTSGGFEGAPLEDGDLLAENMAALGDLDGNGVNDVAVGAFHDAGAGSQRGGFYVLFLEGDSDGDGLYDSAEDRNTDGDQNPATSPTDTDGDGTPDYLDIDDDGDGTPTGGEQADPNDDGFPLDAADADGDGTPDYLDRPVTMFTDGSCGVARWSKTHSGNGGPATNDGDRLGIAATPIGDFDGDGIEDLLTTSVNHDVGGSNRGAAFITYLNADGSTKGWSTIADNTGGFTGVLDNSDQFGRWADVIGDLDNNGTPELLVGAYGDDDGGPNRGAAYILFMNSDGTVLRHQKISSTEGGLLSPIADNDRLGRTAESIGDLDGDGIPELAIGAVLDAGSGVARGALHILFLNADGTVRAEQKVGDSIGGMAALDDDDHFGMEVAALGDLDGDGVTELAVATNRDDDGGIDRGAVYILFMNTDGTVKATQKISSTTGGLTSELEDDDLFGTAVGPLGDLDGDGIPDVVVSSRHDDDGNTDAGAFFILFLNADGTVKNEAKFSETEGNLGIDLNDTDRFGHSVHGIGDLNGDGLTDLVVSANYDDDGGPEHGAFYVIFLDADHDGDGLCSSDEDPNTDGDGDPATNPLDTDNDGIANWLDIDDDGDGLPTATELGLSTDDDGVPNYLDDDDDDDGIPTLVETADDFDGDGDGNHLDLDSDDDGFTDTFEHPYGDSDGDGSPDRLDADPVADVTVVWPGPTQTVVPGAGGSFPLEITNNGPATATNVAVVFPGFAEFDSWSLPNECAAVAGQLVCTFPSIAVGVTETVVLDFVLDPAASAGPVTQTATVSTDAVDYKALNDTTPLTVEIGEPETDLALELSSTTDPVPSGETTTVDVTVTNSGTSTSTDTEVKLVLPPNLVIPAGSVPEGCTLTDNVLLCDLGSIAPGGTVTLAVPLVVQSGTDRTLLIEATVGDAVTVTADVASVIITASPPAPTPTATPVPTTTNNGTNNAQPGATLAFSGASSGVLAGMALLLVAAGFGLLQLSRRRTTATD